MNRNRVNKKRMGRARVLSQAAAGMLAAALCFQPMTALAGPMKTCAGRSDRRLRKSRRDIVLRKRRNLRIGNTGECPR